MSTLPAGQSRPKPKPKKAVTSPASSHEAPVTVGAKMLADAVNSYIEPESTQPRRKRPASFVQAYSTIGQGVPRPNRLSVLRDMQKALAETIRAAEMEERPATLPATGKAQQENDDFMEQMRSQSLSNRENDIASKKLLTSAEMAQKLHLTTAALTAAVRAHRMFVLAGPSGENYYPAFFADEKYDRPVLEKVSKALGGVSGGSKWEFFTTPRFSLNGKSPLEALKKGNIEAVLTAVAAFMDE